MTKKRYLFTSESVAVGHPDKIADQVSDAILDACLREDPDSRVACEVLVSSGLIVLGGEITTRAAVNYREVARECVREIGYDKSSLGFNWRSLGVIHTINKQSPDIARGVEEKEGLYDGQGAGDQGIMFGYASNETEELMPLPIMFAHKIVRELKRAREEGIMPYLGPDAKTQVTVEYDDRDRPLSFHTIVVSAQHSEDVDLKKVSSDIMKMVRGIALEDYINDATRFFINPTGRFVLGGPVADCGLTGRKTIVDTYGGMARHGGGAFSGKDPSKVDRSAAYAARYVAKNIVAAQLAARCEVQVSYAIGVPNPISIKVDAFGTCRVCERELERVIPRIFDLSPKGIVETLDLKRPIYLKTAFGGHFGRDDSDFTWERTDKTEELKKAFNL